MTPLADRSTGERWPELDAFVPILLYAEDVATCLIDPSLPRDYASLEDAERIWKRILVSVTEPPWNGTTHSGDCTKQPHTCFVCYVEEKRTEAGKLAEWLEHGT